MFEILSNIRPTKNVKQTWVLNGLTISDQQMSYKCRMFESVAPAYRPRQQLIITSKDETERVICHFYAIQIFILNYRNKW